MECWQDGSKNMFWGTDCEHLVKKFMNMQVAIDGMKRQA
jgi:hypothetical protein